MNIDDFVSETLKQIIKGVAVAQEFGNTCNAKVNPITARFHSSTEGHAYCTETGVPLQNVEFDVAVTVSEEKAASEEGAVMGAISVSPANSSTTQNSSISRIKFQVLVLLPTSGKQVEY
ncbi:MAG: hypothetical protein K2P74_11425 [Nitrosomonas sp.]|nr:hypothetical protein [Nitrosomonas sp.]